ncbi:unnamed protein product, partial [Cuscuta europaea]
MDSVPVFSLEMWIMIKYDGQWISITLFSSIHVVGLTIPSNCTYDSLYSRVCAAMGENYAGKNIKISYVFAACPPPVNVCDDVSLQFYLQLKSFQKDPMQMPLCVEFVSGEEVGATTGEEAHGINHPSNLEECGDFNEEDNNFSHYVDMDFEFEHISSVEIMRLNSQVDEKIHNMPVFNHSEPTHIALHSIYGSKKKLDFHLKM